MVRSKKAGKPEEREARIEYKKLADIQPAKRNPKLHDVPGIVASIMRFGFVDPPTENAATGRIVAGHGRKEAVEEIRRVSPDDPPLGVKVAADGDWMIPVIIGVSFKNEAEAETYLVGNNKLVEKGGWDYASLAPVLESIKRHGQNAIAASGWSVEGIDAVIARLAAASTAPTEFPSVSPGSVSVTYCCPKCSYKWSGSPDPAKKIGAAAA